MSLRLYHTEALLPKKPKRSFIAPGAVSPPGSRKIAAQFYSPGVPNIYLKVLGYAPDEKSPFFIQKHRPMKNIVLLLLLFFPSLLAAQNWAPVKIGERYNYRQAPADVITQTLWADSMKVENGDSIWYMNRTIRKCDTCSQWGIYYGNQPFFWVKKLPNKLMVINLLISEDTLDIQALDKRRELDFSANTNATIDSVWTENLFGQVPDSFKSILLSKWRRNPSFQKSRHYLWSLPGDSSYTLVGLQGTAPAGEQVPMYKDFYGDGYAVGDVIEWSRTSGGVSTFEPGYAVIHRAQIQRIDTLSNDTLLATMLYWQKAGSRYVFCHGLISPPFEDLYCLITCNPQVVTRKTIPRRFSPSDGWPGQLVYSGQPFLKKK